MVRKVLLVLFVCLWAFSLVQAAAPQAAQKPEKAQPTMVSSAAKDSPVSTALKSMLDVLLKDFQVKKIVGEPIKVGNVILIPVMMVNVGYGGGGGGGTGAAFPMGSGFYLSGEAKPLGFIVVTKAGTKFLSAGPAPRD